MYQVEVKISGISPLRHNKYTIPDRDGVKFVDVKTKEGAIQDALNRSYFDDKKGYYVPKEALKACIINGASKFKVKSKLDAIMMFDDDKYFIDSKDYVIEEGVVRIPPGPKGVRVPKMWVVNKTWGIKFKATILDETFPSQKIKDSIINAGIYFGLLDNRPEYGKFVVDEFKKVK